MISGESTAKLYECIFDKATRTWADFRQSVDRHEPLPRVKLPGLCLIETETADWHMAQCIPPPIRAWLYDGVQFMPLPISPLPQPTRYVETSRLWENALVWFCVHADQKILVWNTDFGIRWGQGQIFNILKNEAEVRLVLESKVWVS